MKFPLTALVSNDEINLVRGGGQVKTARHQQPVSAFLTRLLLAAAPAAVHCCGGQVTHPAAVHQPPTVTAAPSYLVPRFLPPSSSSCRHLGCFHTHTLLSVYALLSSTLCPGGGICHRRHVAASYQHCRWSGSWSPLPSNTGHCSHGTRRYKLIASHCILGPQ